MCRTQTEGREREAGSEGPCLGPRLGTNEPLTVLGSWVKPCGARLGITKVEKGAVRLPKILVLIIGAG